MNNTLLFLSSICVVFFVFNLVLSVIYGKLIMRPQFDLSNIGLWGNKSVRPNYLVGLRARLTSFAGLIAFVFMLIAIVSSYNISYKDNILILNNPIYTNLIGLILGIILSILNFRYNNKKFVDPREGINIYTK